MEHDGKEIIISLSVVCRDAYQLQKVAEVISRAAIGIALEGVMVNMTMAELTSDAEEVDG